MKSDVELVQQALAGGGEAFAPIVDRYKDAVFSIALARLRAFTRPRMWPRPCCWPHSSSWDG